MKELIEWEPTVEEIHNAIVVCFKEAFGKFETRWDMEAYQVSKRAIGQLYAKKLVEWLDEECENEGHGYGDVRTRLECPACQGRLHRQVGLEREIVH